ncbi:hypothetical protein SGRIM128S_09505 [Streptomyces griseomycini]
MRLRPDRRRIRSAAGHADVVLDADPDPSTVGDIAQDWLRRSRARPAPRSSPSGTRDRPPPATRPRVYVDGYAVDPSATVVGSPLRDGAVVSLQDPSGCLPGEPTGLVELRVVGGPAAGTRAPARGRAVRHRQRAGRHPPRRRSASVGRRHGRPHRPSPVSATDGRHCRVALRTLRDERGRHPRRCPLHGSGGHAEERQRPRARIKARAGASAGASGRRRTGAGEDAGETGPGRATGRLGRADPGRQHRAELTALHAAHARPHWSDDGTGRSTTNRPPRLRHARAADDSRQPLRRPASTGGGHRRGSWRRRRRPLASRRA